LFIDYNLITFTSGVNKLRLSIKIYAAVHMLFNKSYGGRALIKTLCLLCMQTFVQLCPTEMTYWAKNYVTISTRVAHCMAYFDRSKLNLA